LGTRLACICTLGIVEIMIHSSAPQPTFMVDLSANRLLIVKEQRCIDMIKRIQVIKQPNSSINSYMSRSLVRTAKTLCDMIPNNDLESIALRLPFPKFHVLRLVNPRLVGFSNGVHHTSKSSDSNRCDVTEVCGIAEE
jgi:hypothetical protein